MDIKLLFLLIRKAFLQGRQKQQTSKKKLKISPKIWGYKFKQSSPQRMMNLESQALKCGTYLFNKMEKWT